MVDKLNELILIKQEESLQEFKLNDEQFDIIKTALFIFY